jgi:hypothetical protein
MEENHNLEVEEIPLLQLPPPPPGSPPLPVSPPMLTQPPPLTPPPPSLLPPMHPILHNDSDPSLTPLPEPFTDWDLNKYLRELLQHGRRGAPDEEFFNVLRLTDYIKIDAKSSDTGISCCACCTCPDNSR